MGKKRPKRGKPKAKRSRPIAMSGAEGVALFRAAIEGEGAGDLQRAAAAYERFLRGFPEDVNAWFNLGRVRMRRGDLDGAAAALGAALAGRPGDAAGHATLGNVLHMQEKFDEALACYVRARDLAPTLPGIHAAMANTLHRLNRPEEAIDALRRAVSADPANPDLYHNLGHSLEKIGRPKEAIEIFRRACNACPGHAGLRLSLGNLLFSQEAGEEAVAFLQEAVSLAPEDTYALSALARKLHKLGRLEKAADAYRRVVAVDPDHPTAGHMLAALTGHRTAKAPRRYVRTAFDRMAERFEDHLVDTLDYNAPALLRDALMQAAGGARFGRTLDMGCGTGLSGLAFADIAGRMTGIDLSSGMLEKARTKGIYTELVEGDIVEFLHGTEAAFDLFIAVDVMVYLGDLAPLFAAVRRRARPGALWTFSTERGTMEDYSLTHSGRYAHNRRYIETLAAGHGLHVAFHRRDDLRREGDRWVNGHLFVLGVNEP